MDHNIAGSETSSPPDWAGRRADARRNHDEVFAAAIEAFAEHGEDATIPEIAARAGVGKATVYRSYPTKAALVEAVAAEHLVWLEERATAAAKLPDAFAALTELLGDIAERLAGDRLFSHVLVRADQLREATAQGGTFAGILERAKDQGRLRADVTLEDIRVLVGGYSRILVELNMRESDQWRRYSRLVLNAFRPDP